MATTPSSGNDTILDGIVARTRLSWGQFIFATSVCFVVMLGLAMYLDQDFKALSDGDLLRVYLTSPLVILYILFMYYRFGVRASNAALAALQHLLGLGGKAFAQLQEPAASQHRKQWMVLGGGLALGIMLSQPWLMFARFTWLSFCHEVNQLLMLSLLSFAIYISLAESSLINKLQRYPMRVDLFDTTDFETLGRSSFSSALLMIGGNTLVIVILPTRYLVSVFGITIIVVIVLLAVASFFLTLRYTHQVMLDAKQRALKDVRTKLSAAFADLKERGTLVNPETVRVWLAYEERLEKVPEWPFNTDTLRSLIVSVFLPAIAFIGRWLFGRFDF